MTRAGGCRNRDALAAAPEGEGGNANALPTISYRQIESP